VQKARTCGVMGREEADAVFMVESGCKKHGSDGGGIHRRLHVVCRAVVEQSGNARCFSWVKHCVRPQVGEGSRTPQKISEKVTCSSGCGGAAVRPSASRSVPRRIGRILARKQQINHRIVASRRSGVQRVPDP